MSDSGMDGSLERLSSPTEQRPPRDSVRESEHVDLDDLLPLANLSAEIEPASSPSEDVQNSDSLENLQNGSRSDSSDSSYTTAVLAPRVSILSNPESFTSASASFSEPKFSFNTISCGVGKDEESDDETDTVFNFSMHVKSTRPAAREDAKDEVEPATYDPVRYGPQVLLNDWFEVTQRRELNKYRHLKLQKGPHQSAYDRQFQHPFAPILEDPEECEKKRNARVRKLWTYLATPTEYSDRFNEPYRKK